MSITVAVQMDPMDGINIKGDSSFALMLAAQAVGVYGSCEIGILHPRLDLDKGQHAPSPGYQIDLPPGVAHPLTQYLPAVQPQPPRGDRLSTPAT